MTTDSYDPLDELVAGTLQGNVPDAVQQRLNTQLADFRAALLERPAAPSARLVALRGRLVLGMMAMAATILIAVGVNLLLRPQASFAEVVAAVQRLPWVHVAITEPDGDSRDVWYSAKENVSASREKDWIEYHDHRLQIYDSFDVNKGVIYRVPDYTPRQMSKFAMIAESLQLLLQSEQEAEKKLLERLKFLEKEGSELTLLDESLERKQGAGREWLEYRLKIRYSKLPDPIEWRFRVDPQTMLPAVCRVEGIWEGKRMTSEQRFDYPERGPMSLYDIGVPQTAKLVDRVPSDEIARILETVRAGRERMDDYRAIVVERGDFDYQWWRETPMILYRKDDKTRADHAKWDKAQAIDKPRDGADLGQWWRDRVDDLVFAPTYMTQGSTKYYVKTHVVKKSDGSKRLEIAEVEETRDVSARPGEQYPPYWSRSPEFVCRPPLGIPNQELEPSLDTSPANGPAGSILLRVARTGRMPRAHDPDAHKHPPRPDAYRNWLDPERGYVIVRHDMMGADDGGKEVVSHSTVIDELAQSPRGVWYAKRFRVKAVPPVEHDQIFDVYIDFDADLPDALFDPPAVGQVLGKVEK